MAVGVSTVNWANPVLAIFRGGGNGVTFTAPATMFVQLHTADPGASGTTAVATTSTRQAATFAAPASGAMALSNTPTFTAAGNETITHISLWSASTVGTFYWSATLSASKTISTGDTLTFSAIGISIAPLAA